MSIGLAVLVLGLAAVLWPVLFSAEELTPFEEAERYQERATDIMVDLRAEVEGIKGITADQVKDAKRQKAIRDDLADLRGYYTTVRDLDRPTCMSEYHADLESAFLRLGPVAESGLRSVDAAANGRSDESDALWREMLVNLDPAVLTIGVAWAVATDRNALAHC